MRETREHTAPYTTPQFEKLLDKTLADDAYWRVNKAIAKKVGIYAAIILADLMSKKKYFENRHMLTDDGYFFNTSDNIEDDTTLSRHKREDATKNLIEMEWLLIDKRGIPAKNFYKIDYDRIYEYLTQYEESVESSEISQYVRK